MQQAESAQRAAASRPELEAVDLAVDEVRRKVGGRGFGLRSPGRSLQDERHGPGDGALGVVTLAEPVLDSPEHLLDLDAEAGKPGRALLRGVAARAPAVDHGQLAPELGGEALVDGPPRAVNRPRDMALVVG